MPSKIFMDSRNDFLYRNLINHDFVELNFEQYDEAIKQQFANVIACLLDSSEWLSGNKDVIWCDKTSRIVSDNMLNLSNEATKTLLCAHDSIQPSYRILNSSIKTNEIRLKKLIDRYNNMLN